MIRPVTLAWLGLATASAGVCLHISHRVQLLEDTSAAISRQIASEQAAIRVLQAEWSYLDQPSRIEKLAARHLSLAPVQGVKFVSFNDVPEKLPSQFAPGQLYPMPSRKPGPDGLLLATMKGGR